MPIHFNVENTPEDPSKVALELAEAMQSEMLHKGEIQHYEVKVTAERSKFRDLGNLIFEVRKKRREGYVAVSRMDPWAEYDLDLLEADRLGCKNRIKQYNDIIKTQQSLLRKHKNNIPKIKKRLATANKATNK